jgi:hypothetical protein
MRGVVQEAFALDTMTTNGMGWRADLRKGERRVWLVFV